MANIEGEPKRLNPIDPPRRRPIPILERIPLPQPSEIWATISHALHGRRSAEMFSPISVEQLSTWLYCIASTQAVRASDRNKQRRFVGSFGALHPAHIILGLPAQRWFVYLPEEHSVGRLNVNVAIGDQLRANAMEFYRAENATLVALLGDGDLVSTYYRDASQLVMRDAGVLLGHAALVASGAGIAFRILGATGSRLLEQLILDLPFDPVSAGLALVGKCVS